MDTTELEYILSGFIFGGVTISYRGYGKLYVLRSDQYQTIGDYDGNPVILIHPEFSMEITEIPMSASLDYIAGFIHGVLIASGALNVRIAK